MNILKKLYSMIPTLEFIIGRKSDGCGLPAAGCPCPTCVIEGSLGEPEKGDMVAYTPFTDDDIPVKFGTVENVEMTEERVLVPRYIETTVFRVKWDDGDVTIHENWNDLTVIKRTGEE